MNQIRRSAMLLRSKYRSLLKFDSLLGFSAAAERSAIVNSSKKEIASSKDMIKNSWLGQVTKMYHNNPYFATSFASMASQKTAQEGSEAKKEISIVGFNAPEETSESDWPLFFLFLHGGLLGGAVAAHVYFETKCESKEREIFNIALKRIQNDVQVIERIGSPITGSRISLKERRALNFSLSQRLENRVPVYFYICGPHGWGKVLVEMFKDKVDEEWKYKNLRFQLNEQLILESSHIGMSMGRRIPVNIEDPFYWGWGRPDKYLRGKGIEKIIYP